MGHSAGGVVPFVVNDSRRCVTIVIVAVQRAVRSSPMIRNALSTLAAVFAAVVLTPFLAYAWYGFMVIFANLFVQGQWDRASWWKPTGYYVVGALFVGVGLLLLIADVFIGVFLRQVFMGDLSRDRGSTEEAAPGVRPRAW